MPVLTGLPECRQGLAGLRGQWFHFEKSHRNHPLTWVREKPTLAWSGVDRLAPSVSQEITRLSFTAGGVSDFGEVLTDLCCEFLQQLSDPAASTVESSSLLTEGYRVAGGATHVVCDRNVVAVCVFEQDSAAVGVDED